MKIRKRVLSTSIATTFAFSLIGALGLNFASATETTLYINEVCTGNNGQNGNITVSVDKKGDYCDWVELYNPSNVSVNLSGWSLIRNNTDVYNFGDISINAGEHKIVFCSKDYAGDASYPNAKYNLSGDGVTLTLNDGTKNVDNVVVPALNKDVCYARKPDGSDNLELLFPTPAASNNNAKSAVPCNSPVFSKEGGMYGSSFNLSLQTDEGNKIYYTTDGSNPATSSTRIEYNSEIPISNRSSKPAVLATFLNANLITPWIKTANLPANSAVDKGTVIRACTLSRSGDYSKTITKSYFVGVSNANHNNLPILSITTDTKNLFDYETGIYRMGKTYDDARKNGTITDYNNPPGNYNQRGREWERECHIEFFENDGTLALAQDCGMRIQGGYSRASYQKSFRFYARDEYGEKNFNYEFFKGLIKNDGSGELMNKYKKLVVRNGGNDSDYTKFKDSYLQSLVSDRAFDTQTGRPCVVFIDGEYWGLYTLQEDYSDDYFEYNFGVDKDEVIVYKTGEIDEGLEEDIKYANELVSFAKKNDMSINTNYRKISQMLDIDSFIDYMVTEMYIINEDWPGNNFALWRTRAIDENNQYSDGRWRMLLYDTEMGLYHYGNNTTTFNTNNLRKIMSNNTDFLPAIFNSLMKNNEFKEKFVIAFMDQTNVNFDYNRCLELVKPFYDAYIPEMQKYFNRFPNWCNTSNASAPCYDRMMTFLKGRPSYVPTMLKDTLGLKNAVPVTVSAINADGGNVKLNTSNLDLTKGVFNGKYFTDYKLNLTAQAKDGYTFKGWTGTVDSADSTISVTFTDAVNLQAIFVKNGEDNIRTVTFKDGTKTFTSYVENGKTVVVPTGVFEKPGYTLSWDKPLTNITANTTINAVYKGNSYLVRFSPNGATGSSYTQSFTYGTGQNLDPCKFTKTGYILNGWATSSSGSIVYTNRQLVNNLTPIQSKTIFLYAVWAKSIPSCQATSVTAKTYTGKAFTPAITLTYNGVKLKSGTDYTIKYTNNTNIGTAKITITGKGAYSGVKVISFKIKPAKVSTIRASRSTKSVRIVWPSVKNAEKYQVYKKMPDNNYKLIGTVSALEYKETGMNSGQVCTYRVRAFANGVYGDFTSITTATRTKAPTIKGTAGQNKASLSWNKCSDSSGYQIQMSTSKFGTYKSIKYTNKNTILQYSKSGLIKGKTYYFKMRSYKTVNGKKLYSNFSNTVAIKVK